jgi:hypothetical protein
MSWLPASPRGIHHLISVDLRINRPPRRTADRLRLLHNEDTRERRTGSRFGPYGSRPKRWNPAGHTPRPKNYQNNDGSVGPSTHARAHFHAVNSGAWAHDQVSAASSSLHPPVGRLGCSCDPWQS